MANRQTKYLAKRGYSTRVIKGANGCLSSLEPSVIGRSLVIIDNPRGNGFHADGFKPRPRNKAA